MCSAPTSRHSPFLTRLRDLTRSLLAGLGSWKQKQGLWKAEQAKKDKEASKEAQVEKKEEQGEQPEGEEKKEEPADEKKDEPMISVNDFDFDVFGVANVNDIGTGEPLC